MPSLKEVKSRINTVKSTLKITSAMKMVASAKLHKAQTAIENMLPYQDKMNAILTNFLSATDNSFESPYTAERPLERVAIVVFSSNTSLCGAFNANVLKLFIQKAEQYKSLGKENVLVYPVGKKIEEAVVKLGYTPQGSYQEMANKPSYEAAYQLAGNLMEMFKNKAVDRVEIIYHHFKSTGSQQLLHVPFLPIDMEGMKEKLATEESGEETLAYNIDYIVEPSESEFIATLLPEVLKLQVFTVLLDSSASEHASRMLAMQAASDNADELIQDLTKQYNKSRQQAITNELLDIIGGSMK